MSLVSLLIHLMHSRSIKASFCFLISLIINFLMVGFHKNMFVEQQINMISEDHCSNDAENTALIAEIDYSLTHIHIENS